MIAIQLHPEQDDLQPLRARITLKQYRILESLEYHGGFKRFDLSLYDDRANGPSEMDKVTAWLQKVFI